jgi:hypothetical protein
MVIPDLYDRTVGIGKGEIAPICLLGVDELLVPAPNKNPPLASAGDGPGGSRKEGLTPRILFAALLREQAMCGRVKTFTHRWRSGLALKDLHVCTPARIITSNKEFAFDLAQGSG